MNGKLRYFVLLIALMISSFATFAGNNYKVISKSRLNVRKIPSTSGIVIGTFASGQEIEVVLIDNGWAKVKYNNSIGYVSNRYITPLEPKEEVVPATANNNPADENIVQSNKTPDSAESVNHTYTEETRDVFFSFFDNTDIYLSARAGVGYSNFLWENGNVYGTLSYSLDVVAQLYFKEAISFIPENWYSEIAIGYEKKGASKFDMNYIRTQICPFGCKIPQIPYDVFVKGGVTLGYPLNDLKGKWKSDFQFGAVLGAQLDWEQFSVGCSFSYDFTEVSSVCGQKLNNFAVLGTVSYKLKKINAF